MERRFFEALRAVLQDYAEGSVTAEIAMEAIRKLTPIGLREAELGLRAGAPRRHQAADEDVAGGARPRRRPRRLMNHLVFERLRPSVRDKE
jgi:hypothetical protein